ncbi:LacI family DNA-binding transcriptional regulator [Streptomyces sp. NPDC056061]|uniref:LacI family DNA-binding transcriptional regulator n=1 Tax=Streptomyces sp. NPDC056061 TaxID=3345700 RepID=UPI0035D8DC58
MDSSLPYAVRHLDDPAVAAIACDHQAVGTDATRHLLSQDMWPVAFLGGRRTSALSARLGAGYLAACRRAGRVPQKWMYITGDYQTEPARAAVTRLLTERPHTRALVAANAPMALGAISAAADLGRRIPEDLAVVCCEDVHLLTHIRPAITAVALDLDELGSQAVGTLTSVLAGEKVDATRQLPYRLVVRESSIPHATGPEPTG